MILVRLLSYLRRHWPRTHILVRGDSHFAAPSVNVGISCNSASSSAVNSGPEVSSKSSCMSGPPLCAFARASVLLEDFLGDGNRSHRLEVIYAGSAAVPVSPLIATSH
jgi:hypothetical protein